MVKFLLKSVILGAGGIIGGMLTEQFLIKTKGSDETGFIEDDPNVMFDMALLTRAFGVGVGATTAAMIGRKLFS